MAGNSFRESARDESPVSGFHARHREKQNGSVVIIFRLQRLGELSRIR